MKEGRLTETDMAPLPNIPKKDLSDMDVAMRGLRKLEIAHNQAVIDHRDSQQDVDFLLHGLHAIRARYKETGSAPGASTTTQLLCSNIVHDLTTLITLAELHKNPIYQVLTPQQ